FQKRPAILEKYRARFKYILVDEFQDTNWAQYELIKTLAAPKYNLAVCADDDQCLPGNALVAVRNGEKEIRAIKKGEEALTAVGKGHIGVSHVNKVFKRQKKARLLTVKTKSGFQVQVTDNHKMFCFVPQVHKNHQYCYVYLMHRQGLGWRMGTTNDLISRTRLERSVDKILAVKAFKTEIEARYYETLWSLKYGIPTSCFQARENIVIQGDLLLKLYQDLAVENNAQRMAKDLNIDLDSHHFCLEAVTRGNKIRIKINLRMCHRNYRSKEHVKSGKEVILAPLIKHYLSIETSDSNTISKLTKAGFHLKKAKKGMALKLEHQDLQELGKIAQHLQELTGGIIETKFNLALKNSLTGNESRRRSFPAILMPAKNLVLGHYLPIKAGREIIYDEIIDIKEEEKDIVVYDLEIDKTHNFFANGVVVHNSIYKFRGASVSNITQFKQDFPKVKEIFLVKNYRSSQNILDLAYNFIQANNPNRLEFISGINKKLIAQNQAEGVVQHLHFKTLGQETSGVVQKIAQILQKNKDVGFNDFAVLARSNDTANSFARAFDRAELPYQFLASQGLYFKPVIMDMIAYLKLLDNYHESSAMFRVLSWPVWQIPADDLMRLTHFSHQKAQSLFETISSFALVKGLSPKTASSLNSFLALVKKHTALAREKNISEIFIALLEDSGYLKKLTTSENREELDYLAQFYKKIKDFEQANPDNSLKNFMAQLNLELESDEQGKLAFDPDQGPDLIKIMTIHGAKGLEFKYVFIGGMVDRRFPSTERQDPIEIPAQLIKEKLPEGDMHLQEERRLCYVAITRAKQGLFFTSADDYG
ncbi:MAG: 3'-5' exonuclease, partial [Patescibacteria group bacterium]